MWPNKMTLQELKEDVSKESPIYRQKSSLSVWTNQVISRRHDTQQNNMQHNDTQDSDIQHNNK